MQFSPASSTVIEACPVGSSHSSSTVVTPASANASTRELRMLVATNCPDEDHRAPLVAACTAWLAPLPPTQTCRSCASTVSPGLAGARRRERSRFTEPTTTTGLLTLDSVQRCPW